MVMGWALAAWVAVGLQTPEPPSTVADLAFMAGSWRGDLPEGGFIEEHWSPMAGGPMMGMFRRVEKGQQRFSEALVISQEGRDVRFRLRHYRGETLESFEGDTPMVFRLVSVKERTATFHGEGPERGTTLVYRRTEGGLEVVLERPHSKAGSRLVLTFKPWTLAQRP